MGSMRLLGISRVIVQEIVTTSQHTHILLQWYTPACGCFEQPSSSDRNTTILRNWRRRDKDAHRRHGRGSVPRSVRLGCRLPRGLPLTDPTSARFQLSCGPPPGTSHRGTHTTRCVSPWSAETACGCSHVVTLWATPSTAGAAVSQVLMQIAVSRSHAVARCTGGAALDPR